MHCGSLRTVLLGASSTTSQPEAARHDAMPSHGREACRLLESVAKAKRLATRVRTHERQRETDGSRNARIVGMQKDSLQRPAKVVGLTGGEMSSFDLSEYAAFWREASQAVALSRRGKVHLVDRVHFAVLRGLHAEACESGPWMGKMPIAVVCKDQESLGGPMLRGIHRGVDGWTMGDGTLVRFFETLPGPEEGALAEPRQLQIPSHVQHEMDELARVVQQRTAPRQA